MRGQRLSREEIVTLNVLSGKNRSNVEIAGILGVTEGAVRYQKRKAAQRAREAAARNDEGAGTDAGDERSGPPAATGIDPGPRVGGKPFKAASFAEAIRHWMEGQRQDRPPNIQVLHEYLVLEHDYPHTYKSVLRYVRAHYPQPKVRTYRRVETPPGAQTQTDWGEFRGVRIAGEEVDLSTFDMVLSYSRMPAVVWSRRKDQPNWQRCHNEAYTRLGGVAAVNRIDNTKTAVSSGAGSWGVLNLTYNSYAKEVSFHIDACQPRQPRASHAPRPFLRHILTRATRWAILHLPCPSYARADPTTWKGNPEMIYHTSFRHVGSGPARAAPRPNLPDPEPLRRPTG